MNRYLKNEKGSMLGLALIFTMIFTLMGYGLINLGAIDAIEVVKADFSAQAFWLAEAGLARTIFLLTQDFKNYPTPSWADGNINGISWSAATLFPASPTLFLPSTNLVSGSNGSYSVSLESIEDPNNSGSPLADEILVQSTGKVGPAGREVTRIIQVYLTMENRNIWDNAIFADCSQTGRVINGNVDIRGSVQVLGSCNSPGDIVFEVSGTGGIGNNYLGADPILTDIMPDAPQIWYNGETVDTLFAKLKVQTGLVSLSGTGTVGDPNVNGNGYKETVDAVYVNDGYTGNQGVVNVYSDNDPMTPYTPYASSIHIDFPHLTDGPYTYGGTTYSTYLDFLKSNALAITAPAELAQLANIDSSSNFDYSNANGRISLDGSGHLTISGIVYIGDETGIVGDLNINQDITYSGSASILVTGNVRIDANLTTKDPVTGDTTDTYPRDSMGVQNIMGVMTPNDIRFGPSSQINAAGIFYAENLIQSVKQTEIAGSVVASHFDMGNQVPSIYQVREVANNLPFGMIGGNPHWVCVPSDWQEVPSP